MSHNGNSASQASLDVMRHSASHVLAKAIQQLYPGSKLGIGPVIDYAGQHDPAGYELRVTQMAVVDELAAAAELVHGKLARVPVAVVRGVAYELADDATTDELIRAAEKDMFR